MSILVPSVLVLALVGAIWAFVVTFQAKQTLAARFAGVIDAEEEQARVREATAELAAQRDALGGWIANARGQVTSMQGTIAALEENLTDIALGLYKPHYGYDDSEAFKQALGALYRARRIAFLNPGIQLVQPGRGAAR